MLKLRTILHCRWLYIFLIICTLLYSLIYLNIFPHKSKIDSNADTFCGTITNIKISGDLLTLEINDIEKVIGNYYFKSLNEKNNFQKEYELGDIILITGTFSKPKNNTVPNLLNYKKYLERKGIYYLVSINNYNKQKENQNLFYHIKNKIINHINTYQSKEYLHTFLLGNNSLLDREIVNTYQENGISHLFAISGMHVSLFSGMILFVFKKLHIKESISYLITILFLFLFMFFLGNSASVNRSVILFSLLGFNKIFKLNIKILHLFIVTFCILVNRNPNILFDVGFQFSFIISLYLILLQDKMKDNSYLKNLFKVSIISFLVSLPISIYYFYQVNLLSIVFNLIFVPFVSIIIFPLSIIIFILPMFDSTFMLLIQIMEKLSFLCNQIEFSKLIFMKPNILWITFYYFFLTIVLLKNNKISIILINILLFTHYFHLALFPKNYFMMIDIGQGDCMLIHSHNQTMLIDTGGKISFSKEEWQEREVKTLTETTILPLLKSLGIRKLDFLILTHGDYDHLGEAINLIHNFKIENIIFNEGSLTETEKEIISLANKNHINYAFDKQNNKYKIGNFNLVSLNKAYDSENDSSIVFLMKYKKYRFLLMGDSSTIVEQNIIKEYNLPNIDFLKVGHHGSKTSTSSSLLTAINPKYALISVGLNNRYRHPSNEVIDRLNDYNSKIFITSIVGTLKINFQKKVTFSINPP